MCSSIRYLLFLDTRIHSLITVLLPCVPLGTRITQCICICYFATMDKEVKPLSNTKKNSTSCRLLNGFAISHAYEARCSICCLGEQSRSVCSVGEPQSVPAQRLSGMPPLLPRAVPLQDENKPLQVLCHLFLAPLACTEKTLALIRQLFPPAIAVEEKGISKCLIGHAV